MPNFDKYNKDFQEILIKCPHCNAEYLPAEIYYPDEFLGRPTDINKIHNTGKLDYYSIIGGYGVRHTLETIFIQE